MKLHITVFRKFGITIPH